MGHEKSKNLNAKHFIFFTVHGEIRQKIVVTFSLKSVIAKTVSGVSSVTTLYIAKTDSIRMLPQLIKLRSSGQIYEFHSHFRSNLW